MEAQVNVKKFYVNLKVTCHFCTGFSYVKVSFFVLPTFLSYIYVKQCLNNLGVQDIFSVMMSIDKKCLKYLDIVLHVAIFMEYFIPENHSMRTNLRQGLV